MAKSIPRCGRLYQAKTPPRPEEVKSYFLLLLHEGADATEQQRAMIFSSILCKIEYSGALVDQYP
jgi:hypothetical protein